MSPGKLPQNEANRVLGNWAKVIDAKYPGVHFGQKTELNNFYLVHKRHEPVEDDVFVVPAPSASTNQMSTEKTTHAPTAPTTTAGPWGRIFVN